MIAVVGHHTNVLIWRLIFAIKSFDESVSRDLGIKIICEKMSIVQASLFLSSCLITNCKDVKFLRNKKKKIYTYKMKLMDPFYRWTQFHSCGIKTNIYICNINIFAHST